ncbi:MAG: membrane protein insertase YidC [Bacteroidia bacterium]
MDKNQIIGFSLIVLIVIGFSIWNQPSEEELARQQAIKDSIAALTPEPVDEIAEKKTTLSAAKEITLVNDSGETVTVQEESFEIKNDLLTLRVSNKGGKISYLQLNEYQRADSTGLVLVNLEEGVNDFGFSYGEGYNTTNLVFNKIESSTTSLKLSAKTEDGASVEHLYALSGEEDYVVNFESNWNGTSAKKLIWTQQVLQQEMSAENERLQTSIYFKETGDEPDYVSERKTEDDEEIGSESRVDWLSFKQHFFNQAIIPSNGFENGYLKQDWQEGDEYIKELHASMDLVESNTHKFKMIFVPNHYSTLRQYDIELERVVNLGWGIFGWINRFAVIPIFNLLSKMTSNYGIIILILTILFKSVLLFFTYKSFLSGAKMRVLKPELDAIKKKNDGDMQAQQQEQMKLYQATGVSPFGGCLPMLVQMPILLALFNFFPHSFELRQQPFLWAHDLSTYDSIYEFGFSIPGYGDHISLFALLMTITTFIYTLINQSYQPQQQKELKYLPYFMPIIFLTFLNSYSAALSYYYFLANLFSIGQTYLFKAFVNEDKLRAQIEEKKKQKASSGGGAASTGMQGRMQEWMEKQQRKQQAIQQQKNKKKR